MDDIFIIKGDAGIKLVYQQIQTEKQRLIAEKKIKKEKPLAEIIEDEIPFDIPESWKWVRWGEVINIVSAKRVVKFF